MCQRNKNCSLNQKLFIHVYEEQLHITHVTKNEIHNSLIRGKNHKIPPYLNHDIQEVVELHDHETLESLLHQATKVDKRIQIRKDFQRHSSWNSSHKEKKDKEKTHQGKYSKTPYSSSKDSKPSSSKYHKTSSSHAKTHASLSSPSKPKIEEKTNSIKCFK